MILTIANLKSRFKEIWFHAGFQKYFRNTGWLFTFRIASMIVSFLISISVARYLGPSNLGIINYSVSLVGLFSFLASLGIDSILYRDLVNSPENENELMGTAFFLRLFGSVLALIGVIVTMIILHGNALTNAIILIIASGYIFQCFLVIPFYFQAKVISKPLSLSMFFGVVVLSLLKLVLILVGAGIYYFAAVLLAEPILYMIIYWFIYNRAGRRIFSWRFDKRIAKSMLLISWPLMFTGAFSAIYSRIDQVMLGSLLNSRAVGIYSVAALLSEYWYFVPLGIVSSLVPAIINGRKSGEIIYKKRLRSLLGLIALVGVTAALFFTFFSDKLIQFFYGSNYIEAANILKIYIWGGVGMSLGFVVNQLLIIENKTKIIFVFGLISMLVNVILNVLLIPKFGMYGAAVATLISYSIIPLPILFIKY